MTFPTKYKCTGSIVYMIGLILFATATNIMVQDLYETLANITSQVLSCMHCFMSYNAWHIQVNIAWKDRHLKIF